MPQTQLHDCLDSDRIRALIAADFGVASDIGLNYSLPHGWFVHIKDSKAAAEMVRELSKRAVIGMVSWSDFLKTLKSEL